MDPTEKLRPREPNMFEVEVAPDNKGLWEPVWVEIEFSPVDEDHLVLLPGEHWRLWAFSVEDRVNENVFHHLQVFEVGSLGVDDFFDHVGPLGH